MKYCIFLCDHQWNIVKIMDSSPTCPLSEGARLPELLENPELLPLPDALENQVQSVSLWQLKGGTESFCAILCPFPRYHLVFLVRVTDEQGFTRFTDLYVKNLNWAQDHLQMPYTDEYSCIQQMNNQLINEVFGRKAGDQLLQNLALFLPGLLHKRPFRFRGTPLRPGEAGRRYH